MGEEVPVVTSPVETSPVETSTALTSTALTSTALTSTVMTSDPGAAPSLSLRLLGVDPGRVRLERLLALVEGLLAGPPAAGAEDVPLDDLREPVPQLDEVDLVLLEFGVGEVVLVVLLQHLPQEVLALVDDLLVLVVARRLERGAHLRLAREHGAGHQHGRTGHVGDLAPQLAQCPLVGRRRGQGRHRVLQVDRAQRLDAPPYRGTKPGRLGRHPVDKQQPAPAVRHVLISRHPLIEPSYLWLRTAGLTDPGGSRRRRLIAQSPEEIR